MRNCLSDEVRMTIRRVCRSLVAGLVLILGAELQIQDAHAQFTAKSDESGDNQDATASTFGTAVGNSSIAGLIGTAVGASSSATGDGSTAVGASSTAAGIDSTAVGNASSAAGIDSTAVGGFSNAGSQAIAVGRNANASFIGSAAFGAYTSTTRDFQMLFGETANTYTLPGIPSQASQDAQSGLLRLISSDSSGNLAEADVAIANGNFGFGIANPTSRLHTRQSAITGAESLARFEVSDDATGRLDFNNATSTNGAFIPRIQGRSGSTVAALITEGLIANDTGLSPVIVYNAAKISGGAVATRPLVVYRNNNVAVVTVAANGNVTATSFINASSRELKDGISDLDSAKASAALRQLTPVEFTYKNDATREPRVGFIAEDVPDLIAEPERKSVPVMDVVAVLTRVVKDQQQTIDGQQNSLNRQAEVINDLTKRLVALERSRNAGE